MKIELVQEVDKAKGQVAGAVYDLSDANATLWINSGKAKAHGAPTLPALGQPIGAGGDGATLSGTVAEGIQVLIGKSFLAGVEAAEKKGGTGVRTDVLSQLGRLGLDAQPKEEKSMPEWLWAVAHSTKSMEMTSLGKKAGELLFKKYNTKHNANFHEDWEKATEGGTTFDMQTKAASVQTEGVGGLGGFSVPTEFFPQVQTVAFEESEIYRRVSKFQMMSNEMLIPVLDYTGGGSGASPYLAGMVANWFSDGATLPQTNMKIRQMQLKAWLLGGYTQAGRTLVADSPLNFQQMLVGLMGQTIAFYLTYAIINGSGAGQPRGIINAAAAIAVTRTGDSSNGSTFADIANMDAKLLPGSEKRAMWLMAPSMKPYLYQMNDASGRIVYLPNFPGTAGGPASTTGNGVLLNKPVEINQYAASHGSAADIILVDPAAVALGERQDIEIGVSEHVAYLSNLLTWRFIYRGDARPKLSTYLTLQNGDTVSPFVYRHA